MSTAAKPPGHQNEGPDWDRVVKIACHLITLNLVIAILVAAFFLFVEKTQHEGPVPESWKHGTVDPE